jgi:hypothetical protein
MVEGRDRRRVVLSQQEQRVWEDVQRFWTTTAEEPAYDEWPTDFRPATVHPDPVAAPVWAVVGLRIGIVLVLLGVVVPGLVVTVASAVGWGLRRFLRGPVAEKLAELTLPVTSEEPATRAAGP